MRADALPGSCLQPCASDRLARSESRWTLEPVSVSPYPITSASRAPPPEVSNRETVIVPDEIGRLRLALESIRPTVIFSSLSECCS